MLNKELKLNPKIFDKDCEQSPIRKGFGEGLLLAAEKDSRIVGLCADLTESTKMDSFKKKFPERFIEIGVAEQNLASVASGLAAGGKIPFISSYAVFSPGRNWEQIRTTICYNNVPVKIAGSHGGVSVGPDGGSHQALEDIAITRVLPRMTVLTPCDSIEAKKATMAAAEIEGPVYIRLAREATPIITSEETPFEVGKAQIFWSCGHLVSTRTPDVHKKIDVGIIACGALVARAIKAAAELEKEGIAVSVMNLGTIKPIDEKAIIDLAKKAGAIVTAEEHQIAGGAGGAVAEVLAANCPVPIEFVGVHDQFGQSGSPDELIEHYGLDETAIKGAVKIVLKRKSKI
ncbi:MAG TPA: transketolase C-terminal domain-containing protein [Candidatus Paceibacterota bacterium]